jgi:hypothetical protein
MKFCFRISLYSDKRGDGHDMFFLMDSDSSRMRIEFHDLYGNVDQSIMGLFPENVILNNVTIIGSNQIVFIPLEKYWKILKDLEINRVEFDVERFLNIVERFFTGVLLQTQKD